MAFTDKWASALLYGGDGKNADFYWEGSIPGFGLKVYPSNRKMWVLKYRFNGRQRLKSLGQFPILKAHDAFEKAIAQKRALNEDRDPIDEDKKAVLFSDFCEIYIERHSKIHNRSWQRNKRRAELHLSCWSGRKLKSITRQDVSELHSKIGTDRPAEANLVRRQLSKMFELAKIWGYLPETFGNPARGIGEFPSIKRDRFLRREEMPAVMASLEKESIYVRNGIKLYMLTAFRHEELLNLQWPDVDLEQGFCIVRETKNGKPLYSPLSPQAIKLLKELPKKENNPWLFPGTRSGKRRYDLNKAWERVRERAGLTDVWLHDLRRTNGAWLALAGYSLPMIGKILNHSTQHVTAVYAQIQLQDTRQAVEHIGNVFEQSWGQSG